MEGGKTACRVNCHAISSHYPHTFISTFRKLKSEIGSCKLFPQVCTHSHCTTSLMFPKTLESFFRFSGDVQTNVKRRKRSLLVLETPTFGYLSFLILLFADRTRCFDVTTPKFEAVHNKSPRKYTWSSAEFRVVVLASTSSHDVNTTLPQSLMTLLLSIGSPRDPWSLPISEHDSRDWILLSTKELCTWLALSSLLSSYVLCCNITRTSNPVMLIKLLILSIWPWGCFCVSLSGP